MNTAKHFLIQLLLLALIHTSVYATEKTPLQAFPEAQADMLRYVIELPEKDRAEEQNYQVELYVGAEMETDGVNRAMLSGNIEARPLKGWGYTYYEVTGQIMTLSTLMGVAPDQPKVVQFVHTAPLLVRYNSRLPIVVYVPAGHEVRYRIWSAPDTLQPAKEG